MSLLEQQGFLPTQFSITSLLYSFLGLYQYFFWYFNQFVSFVQFQYGFSVSCCEYLLIDYSVVVDHPIFEYVLGCKVENINLKMIEFDIKVENENDNRIT